MHPYTKYYVSYKSALQSVVRLASDKPTELLDLGGD